MINDFANVQVELDVAPIIGPIQRPTAQWNIELMVDCPWCGDAFDLVEQWQEHGDRAWVEPLESGQQIYCECPRCHELFECETSY